MWLKACWRCEGDLYLRDSEEGKEIACMQCGYIATPTRAVQFLRSRGLAAQTSRRAA